MMNMGGESVVIDGTGGAVATTTIVPVNVVNGRGRSTFARRLVFRNEGPTNNLMVSLGSTVFTTIAPGASLEIYGPISQFLVKSSAATTAWTAIATVA